MTRKNWWLACSLFGLAIATTACFGQDQTKPSTGKRVGEKLDSAVQSLKRGAKEAGESIQQQYARARTAVHNMGVSSRIYARLHWDKELQTSKIDIDVKKDGVATLKGTVPDAKAKAKALALAQDTVGVVRVMDQMTVGTTPTETSTTTETTTTTKRTVPKP